MLLESKGNCAFKKAAKICFFKSRQTLRERGNQRFRCDGFPSPLDPHPFLSPTRGHPWTPYVITRNSWSFASAPKNAVHFLYGAVLHRPVLLPPLQSVFAKDTAFFSAKAQKLQNSACAEFWDGLPVSVLVCFFPFGSRRAGALA